ncbi:MAG TPA: 3-dehydroquinate synthase [Candidatus Omnitrophota bacterium]|nr:3-dehydroquinate synthase [Candidatus Omnitrophota bacterium]HPT07647.1 3-dehydroquinate synthase [Candidatus Omnitrophota bacterium]
MKPLRVELDTRSYPIIIGTNIQAKLPEYAGKLAVGNAAFIISNPLIFKKYGLKISRNLAKKGFFVRTSIVADSEKSKSIAVLTGVLNDLSDFDTQKKTFIVALGGGVIGDLAGFAASIYKRGIPYIQVPTTLLAQVDSSIGGKTGVDLPCGKNLAGTFYQPKLVLSDCAVLKTLDTRQLRSGLAEVIKYACIQDKSLFDYLCTAIQKILNRNMQALEFIVHRCSELKAKIVTRDEREDKGLRTILNFGHTIGHAIETAGGYKKYNHGEAVSLGMLIAVDISVLMHFLDLDTAERIESLIEQAGLPLSIKNLRTADIINAHFKDKKFIGAKNRLVLLHDIGTTTIVENIPLEIIRQAISKRLQK